MQINFDGRRIDEISIDRIKVFEPPEGYYLAFSGGKDSVVIHDLTLQASVKFDAHYSQTGIDPPELVQFIKQYYPQVVFDKPKTTMWKLIEKYGLPTRLARFCCEDLKECHGEGRFLLTGIRHRESIKRQKRQMVESCNKGQGKRFLHPIIDWSTSDVWQYVRERKLPYCSLYDEGFKRLGCILCPMQGYKSQQRELQRWPKIAEAYHRAALRSYKRKTKGMLKFKSGEDYWQWWLSQKGRGNNEQCSMFT